jgi:hypothetical protein
MKKLGLMMALMAVAGLTLFAAPQEAAARPQYKAEIEKKYTKIADELTKAKCDACHGMEDGKSNKKLLSDYAKALSEALGKKNERDKDAIKAALDKVGTTKNGDGKSYAELLDAGKLPKPHESIKQ